MQLISQLVTMIPTDHCNLFTNHCYYLLLFRLTNAAYFDIAESPLLGELKVQLRSILAMDLDVFGVLRLIVLQYIHLASITLT